MHALVCVHVLVGMYLFVHADVSSWPFMLYKGGFAPPPLLLLHEKPKF